MLQLSKDSSELIKLMQSHVTKIEKGEFDMSNFTTGK